MDHAKVDIRTTSMSCGVLELGRISEETEEVLFCIASYLYHPSKGQPAAFILASDVDGKTTTSKLWNLLETLNLYDYIHRSLHVENPKTGNIIRVYTWAIKHESFKKWYSEQRILRIKKQG